MALIATIFTCDNCEAVIMLRNDHEWKHFEMHWADGVHQFCPQCKDKPEVKILIEKEEETFFKVLRNEEQKRSLTSEVIQ